MRPPSGPHGHVAPSTSHSTTRRTIVALQSVADSTELSTSSQSEVTGGRPVRVSIRRSKVDDVGTIANLCGQAFGSFTYLEKQEGLDELEARYGAIIEKEVAEKLAEAGKKQEQKTEDSSVDGGPRLENRDFLVVEGGPTRNRDLLVVGGPTRNLDLLVGEAPRKPGPLVVGAQLETGPPVVEAQLENRDLLVVEWPTRKHGTFCGVAHIENRDLLVVEGPTRKPGPSGGGWPNYKTGPVCGGGPN
eukprot:gene29650-5067_t